MVLSTSAAIPHTFKNWFPLQCSSWDRSMEMQAVNQCRFPNSKWVKVSQAHAKCFSLIQEMSFLKILKQLSLLEIATRHRELTAGMLFKNTPPPFFPDVSGNFLTESDARKIQISSFVFTIFYEFMPGFLFINVFACILLTEQAQTT